MNLSTFLVVLIILLSASQKLTSQEVFKVLAVRGSVTVIGGKGLAVGQKLKASDKLNVGKGAYASLAHVNGRTVEIRKEGAIKVSDLDKAASKKTGSVSGKFAKYVVGELTEVSEPIAFKDSKRGNMRTTGSVERAAGDEVNLADSVLRWVGGPGELQALAAVESGRISNGSVFSVVMPRHTRLLRDTVEFFWHRSPEFARYKLVITDRNAKVVFAKETADTLLQVSLAAAGVTRGSVYTWHVEKSGNQSERTGEYVLWMLDGADRSQAEAMLTEIRDDVEDQSSSIGLLIVAAACEDQGLMYDAFACYRKAVADAPDIQNYKRLYAEFLIRQSLNLEAYLAYK